MAPFQMERQRMRTDHANIMGIAHGARETEHSGISGESQWAMAYDRQCEVWTNDGEGGMMLIVKKFGHIKVYIDEPNALNDNQRRVTINWYAIGEVSVADAREFAADLGRAIEVAASELRPPDPAPK